MTDPHNFSGAYALNALTDDEARLFERHLDSCSSCREEVAGLVATAARLGEAVAPPAHLRAAVLDTVGRTRQLPPTLQNARNRRRLRSIAGLAIAASVIALISLAVGERTRAERATTAAAQVRAVLAAADARTGHGKVDGGGTLTAVVSESLHSAVVTLAGVPNAPDQRTYEFWVLRAGDARPAGLTPHGDQLLVDDVSGKDTIALTVEPAGGVEKATTSPIAVVSFPQPR